MWFDVLWSLPLTVGTFWIMRRWAIRRKNPLVNPLLLSLLVIIPLLLFTGVSYERYFAGSRLVHELLQFGVVALAFPLYKQLPAIVRRWKIMLGVCCIAVVVAMISGVAIAIWLGANQAIAASILPKSVTTPIALAITEQAGGIPAITAVCVILVGILGAVFGHAILNNLGITSKSARGMAIGASSHVIGTAHCNEVDREEGAFASLALVLCGVLTALSANLIFPWLMSCL
ncbi:MAG: CidB/LrgB family autolysis modulator [Neisseria sp.]|nr:CidB/LrgB family autolysis modulator [Neisseria sp.]